MNRHAPKLACCLVALAAAVAIAGDLLMPGDVLYRASLIALVLGLGAKLHLSTRASRDIIDSARSAGYDSGYDAGYADGRHVARPVVVHLSDAAVSLDSASSQLS